jgi:hypothetical protein
MCPADRQCYGKAADVIMAWRLPMQLYAAGLARFVHPGLGVITSPPTIAAPGQT